MKLLRSSGLFAGRLCIALIFILSGFAKIMNWGMMAGYMASKGMTFVPLFLVLALIIEILGGFAILVGYFTRIAAILLLLYLIPVTGIFHDYWNASGNEYQLQMIMFLKNIAIFGGLIYVATCGAGGFSFDRFMHKHEHEEK